MEIIWSDNQGGQDDGLKNRLCVFNSHSLHNIIAKYSLIGKAFDFQSKDAVRTRYFAPKLTCILIGKEIIS